MAAGMPQIQPLVDTRVLRPAETALALDLISEVDLLRLKTIARLYARGLPPDVTWDDLLQEAFTRVIQSPFGTDPLRDAPATAS
jgi:RNA polymerase sigma-70 factor (ECF subfamily)